MGNALNLQEINQDQALTLGKFFIQSGQSLFLFGQKGTGKMLDLETELPTPNGFVKLLDLKEGDQLFDERGNICNIIKLHPIDFSPKSYKIIFDDKTEVNACEDHLWLTWDGKARAYSKNPNTKCLPSVKTTEEIFRTLKTYQNGTNHSIQVAYPINYPKQDLLIDPYVLGCWLGDGTSKSGSIECADNEILDEIKKSGYSVTLTKRANINRSKSFNYRIGDLVDTKYTKIGLLKKQLQQLQLIGDKHIPDIYLRASFEQRLSLLQGLMDTDGCCDRRCGAMEYCSVIPVLAAQVLQLMSSLGIKATLHKNKSFLYGKRHKDRYRIHCITKLPIFRLTRKLFNIKKTTAQDTRNTHRYIVDVKLIDPVPMRCVTVDSQSHLFLITRAFIATHNTHIALQAAKDCKLKVNYINLSVIERSDLCGFPNLNSPGDLIEYKSPAFLPPLIAGVKPDSIILFDEVDKASPEVMSPLLEILQFKTINGKQINAAACVLTGNLPNEKVYSNQISSALLDRGSKYILQFNFDLWVDWAKKNNVHDLILGFLRSNSEFACGKTEDCSFASPSPRGWTLASEAIIKAKELKIVDIESVSQIVSGYVGMEAGLRFKTWYEFYRQFDPFVVSLIETGAMKFDYQTLHPTERVIFVITACHYAKQKVFSITKKSKARLIYLENLCNFLIKYKVDYEVQLSGLYNSFTFDQIALEKLYECKVFFDLFTSLSQGISIKK
jgi:hypothetical protein